jgi:hypothetical protein
VAKRAQTPSENADSDAEQLIPNGRASLGAALADLELNRVKLAKKMGRAKAYNRDDASHYAWLTKQISQIMEAVSKLDARVVHTATNISPALVMAHLRGQPQERRHHIIRELQAMDSEQPSVLA